MSVTRQKRCRSDLLAIASPSAGELAPVFVEGLDSDLGQPSPPCNHFSVPRRDCLRLVRSQDAPVKAVCPSRSGVSDDATRLAFRVDEQLGARADPAPLRWCRGRSTPWPGAQFTSKPPKIFSVVFRHSDGHPSQPGGLCGSGREPPFTHRRAPRQTFDPSRRQRRPRRPHPSLPTTPAR
jgi:hypothetical protein